MKRAAVCLAVLASLTFAPARSLAQATLLTGYGGTANYGTACLGMNDDGSSNVIDLTPYFPAGLHFFSQTHTSAYVNTNGNITFAGALPTFTPQGFPVANQPMIAPFWADVDTRTLARGVFPNQTCNGPGNGVAVMGPACMNPANDGIWWHLESGLMVVTWDRVARYLCETRGTLRDSFQLIIRAVPPMGCSGATAGTDFDVEFRFNRCDWEVGEASGDANGDGMCQPGEQTTTIFGTQPCVPGQSGFDEGIGAGGHYTAIPGSLAHGIATHLCTASNTMPSMPGIWQFQVRNGVVMTCPGAGVACMVGGQMGVCAQGRTSCPAGSSTPMCVQQVMPNPEICDNLDNDCDGTIDESNLGNLCGAFQVCQAGTCVDGCFEGNCPTGYTCSAGQCVDPACIGMTCPAGERCVMGTCRMPCAGVTCPHGQTCNTGRCVDPCANIMCDMCTACVAGACAMRCTASSCPAGQSCNASGLCVDRACVGMTCPAGTYCAGGACMDACIGATCPFGQMCTAGQCVPTITPDAGMSTIDAFIPQNDASFRDGGPVMMMMDAGPAHDAAITHTPSRAASCGCRAGSARSGASALVLAALAMWIGKLRRR